jgi:hypothetical protein
MVRRRSTVRFRKGAPGYENFSNMEPSTFFERVSFEWQTPSRTGACDQAICRGDGPRRATPAWGTGPGLAQHSAPTGRATSWHGSTKSDERPGLWVIRLNRSTTGQPIAAQATRLIRTDCPRTARWCASWTSASIASGWSVVGSTQRPEARYPALQRARPARRVILSNRQLSA